MYLCNCINIQGVIKIRGQTSETSFPHQNIKNVYINIYPQTTVTETTTAQTNVQVYEQLVVFLRNNIIRCYCTSLCKSLRHKFYGLIAVDLGKIPDRKYCSLPTVIISAIIHENLSFHVYYLYKKI